ncbi:hypothetical protein EES39_32465 [Streptomyces sp. ADI92-24]|nr:hypothetical protein EES39_32465 [Streptomyces sp. ADI92-24]
MGCPVGVVAAEVGRAGPGAVVGSPGGRPQVGAGGDGGGPGARAQCAGADVEPGHIASDAFAYPVEPGGHIGVVPQAGGVVEHLHVEREHVADAVVVQMVHEVVGRCGGAEEVSRQPVVTHSQARGAGAVDMAGIRGRGVGALGELASAGLDDDELPAFRGGAGVVDAQLVVRDVQALQVCCLGAGRAGRGCGTGGREYPGRGQGRCRGGANQGSPAHASSGEVWGSPQWTGHVPIEDVSCAYQNLCA